MKCSVCSAEVHPVVAVDIDGTLGAYHEHFVDFAAAYLGRPLREDYDGAGPFNEALEIDKPTYRQVKLAYRQGGMKRSMPVYPGAKDFVDWLRAAGVEVWITTTRPYLRLDNIDPDTREWMYRSGIVADGILYDEDKYEQLTDRVDVGRIVAIVDDLEEQCLIADTLGLIGWQPERRHNRGARWLRGFTDFSDLQKTLGEDLARWKELYA